MRILVTGGAGDIGTYAIRDLASHGHVPTILDLRSPPEVNADVGYVCCDLMNLESTLDLIRDCDVVVHLAAIPHPYNDPPDRVMAVNMVTCFNVLEAVRLNGIRRIVYGCSESSSGFGIHNVELRPDYLPIDEEHPCWPHETYSLTKRFGEEMVENYTRAYGIEGISLRYCWVWLERDADSVRSIVRAGLSGETNPKNWFGCFIAPHDVAQAIRLAAEYRFGDRASMPFEAFYLTADTTCLPVPTLEVLGRHYHPLPEIRDRAYFDSDLFAPPIDSRKARKLLGFQPTKDWRRYDAWEKP